MDIITTKTVDMLTRDGVSILTKKFIEIEGVQTQVGNNERCAYANSAKGREALQMAEPDEVINAVFAIWGDTVTVKESTV